MFQIVGFVRKTGTYEGYDYDNINMHCIDLDNEGFIGGNPVTIVKIKVKQVQEVFDGLVKTDDDFRSLIGSTCRVLFDRSGKYAADIQIKDQGGGDKK